jgi:hypothetical protein
MADRYQDRPFPADDGHDRGNDPRGSARGENDPLAELARLIGQADPLGSMGRANHPVQPRTPPRDPYQSPAQREPEPDDVRPAGPPPWMQRAARPERAQQHYAPPHAASEPDYQQPPFADAGDQALDPSRYDDALYGQIDPAAQEFQHDPAYADDPYYQGGEGAEHQVRKRGGGIVTVVVILALAVVGTAAAFAYRTYVGSSRSGEPPIIRADAGPTKIVPAPTDGAAKVPDRLASGDGTERIVPREEAPVDLNARSGPRVVFPALNPNGNPPSPASVAPTAPPPASAGNGTLPSNEPRKIKTFSVRGDQADGAAAPVTSAQPSTAKSAPAVRTAANANASSANAPLSLAPQATQPSAPAETRTRVAATNPVQIVPSSAGGGVSGATGYLVQVSSQRNEADAQASYRAIQSKFPAVLGSRAPLIKRADLGDKGVYYRAMVGPFGSPDEASQFCGSLKTAGGQCVVQRN